MEGCMCKRRGMTKHVTAWHKKVVDPDWDYPYATRGQIDESTRWAERVDSTKWVLGKRTKKKVHGWEQIKDPQIRERFQAWEREKCLNAPISKQKVYHIIAIAEAVKASNPCRARLYHIHRPRLKRYMEWKAQKERQQLLATNNRFENVRYLEIE